MNNNKIYLVYSNNIMKSKVYVFADLLYPTKKSFLLQGKHFIWKMNKILNK